MFPVAQDTYAQDKGARHGSWHVTHNMYTQVSSECGLLAIALYIGIIIHVHRRLTFIQKKIARVYTQGEWLASMTFWLQAGFIGFCVSGFFLSVAYTDILPLLAGITVALERAILWELRLPEMNLAPTTTRNALARV